MPPEADPFDVPGARGERVRGDVILPPSRGRPAPVVVVLHGFKGFRRWGFFPWFAERIADLGFAAVTFDFSHNGTDASGEAYPRKDLFRASTWGTHQEDLEAVLGALRNGALPGATWIDPKRVALLGHSMGGALAVLHAARHGGVRCVAALAPVASADRTPPDQKAMWRERGEMPIVNSRTGEVLPLGVGFLEDVEARRADLDAAAAAEHLPCPLLVVHGEEDTSVLPAEGLALVQRAIAAGRPARFVPLRGTQHTFDAVHPFAGPTPALRLAWREVATFLETYLVRFDPEAAKRLRGGR